jgi:hypothetical protein
MNMLSPDCGFVRVLELWQVFLRQILAVAFWWVFLRQILAVALWRVFLRQILTAVARWVWAGEIHI